MRFDVELFRVAALCTLACVLSACGAGDKPAPEADEAKPAPVAKAETPAAPPADEPPKEPQNSREWHEVGVKAAIAKDHAKAIEYFDKSIAAESDLKYVGPWPFYSRGQSQEALGNKDKALADYTQACDMKLNDACKAKDALAAK